MLVLLKEAHAQERPAGKDYRSSAVANHTSWLKLKANPTPTKFVVHSCRQHHHHHRQHHRHHRHHRSQLLPLLMTVFF